MLTYLAPTEDYAFNLNCWLKAPEEWLSLPEYSSLDLAAAGQILNEAARFVAEFLVPLDALGDAEGCRFEDSEVRTPEGFRAAYRAFVDGGWPTLACVREFGGMGLPQSLNAAIYEMLNAGSHAWTMYTGVAHGAYECLRTHGRPELQQRYLPKLVSGEWLATMCVTEPAAGSDVGLLRTRAEPAASFSADGACLVSGTKIFISGGEQDLTENILHLVLARLPGAPAGTKGISLVLVPKFVPTGTTLEPNAVRCVGIEHKMGLRGSATCTMSFEGARGWLIGEPSRGLAAMFIMMNAARLSVGLQGLAHADITHQNALRYALWRRQSRASTTAADGQAADLLVEHPSVQRLLMEQRAVIQSERTLALWTAHLMDLEKHHTDAERRRQCSALLSILTPIAKAMLTSNGFRLSSTALQVFGGYGYICDTGIERRLRDSRIAMIYEGTNEIQALDLVRRKLLADSGSAMGELLLVFKTEADECVILPEVVALGLRLARLTSSLTSVVAALLTAASERDDLAGRVSTDFLAAMGSAVLAYIWARAARSALSLPVDDPMRREKQELALYYYEFLMPEADHHLQMVQTWAARACTKDVSAFLCWIGGRDSSAER